MAQLLITNCTGFSTDGGVYLLDTGSGSLRHLFQQPVRGITASPHGYYTTTEKGEIFRLDPESWEVTPVASLGIRGGHDIRWFRDSFYLVACYGNQVLRLSPDFDLQQTLRIVEHDDDVCHANCLTVANDELLLSIFTLSGLTREEKNGTRAWRTEGKLLRLDLPSGGYEVLHEPLCQPHSPVWHNGALYCCESYTAHLTRLAPGTREGRRVGRLRGFVRGLAMAEGRAYAGVSYRRLERLSPVERWLEQRRKWCGVVELNLETWKPLRRFPVPGRFIYEVLAIGE